MRVLIAGGGTGGHVYPALAIAKAIKRADPTHQVEFVGTGSGLEVKLVPREGFQLHTVAIGKVNNVSWGEKLRTLVSLPVSFWQSYRILRRFKPDAVIGVGGYASFPMVWIASLLGVRALIWEPNAVPGMANRYLSRFVEAALVVFDEAKHRLKSRKSIKVSMPVREEMSAPELKYESDGTFHVLAFGGSQGARTINTVLSEMVCRGGDWLSETKIVHQTGPADYSRVSAVYAARPELRPNVELREYLDNMPERYAWADIVICRSGTGTISELAAVGKPAILIPLPSAADDHQTKNAMALANVGAAVLIPQKDLTPERLLHEIETLRRNPERRREMAEKVKAFHRPRADEEIARYVLGGPT